LFTVVLAGHRGKHQNVEIITSVFSSCYWRNVQFRIVQRREPLGFPGGFVLQAITA
jgi:hypothetical protein